MSETRDRLYQLLPVIYRQRDADQGYPLRALLQIISDQVEVVEDDIEQLYDNWFIETCEDWVVPYIGDLIGYRPVNEAGVPGEQTTARARQRNKILVPRREVANTIRNRRRKGTLALLELLAQDVAGWPARAVEFYRYLSFAQSINDIRLDRGCNADLRNGDALDRIDGPFDELSHTPDVRSIQSCYQQGQYNIPHVGVFIWRLKSYAVTRSPAYCVEQVGPQFYTFSVLGNDTPLFTRPQREQRPTDIAGEINLPVPIRRRVLKNDLKGDAQKLHYYGENKSLVIWKDTLDTPVSSGQIVVGDLSDWIYQAPHDKIVIDPVLGRMVFPARKLPEKGVWVSYQYGFSAEIGGGEYRRQIWQPEDAVFYRVGRGQSLKKINEALDQWKKDDPDNAVIEITDSGVYVEQINIELPEGKILQLRAAQGVRPVIRLLDWLTDLPDSLTITGESDSHFILDGLLVTGRAVRVEGELTSFTLRHTTLVPGWTIDSDCTPKRPPEPSLEVYHTPACIVIEQSILGSILVHQDQVRRDPNKIRISDSIVDATSPEKEALSAPDCRLAHAVVTILRATVFGTISTHVIELAENSIFIGMIKVARSQIGCMRFCYLTLGPGVRTPRRYRCQPDLAENAVETEGEKERARIRVQPQFNSVHFGTPTYCQLSQTCALEISRGADDESEMGVFHDLFQPQRAANLRVRLDEYTPSSMEVGIIYSS
jgi:hypothetical protein